MRWDVQVFGGAEPDPDELARIDRKFGTPFSTVDFDGGISDPAVPLIYSGVLLETVTPGSVSLWGKPREGGGVRALHVIDNVWHVQFGIGSVDIEGLELREDGVAVHSRWECIPAPPSEEDEALLRRILGEEGQQS